MLGTLDVDSQVGAVIERIVGHVWFRAGDSDANNSALFAWMIMDLDAINATAFPELEVDDPSVMYLGHQIFRSGLVSDIQQLVDVPIDFKPRRRFKGMNDRLVFLVENQSDGANDFFYSYALRVLLSGY